MPVSAHFYAASKSTCGCRAATFSKTFAGPQVLRVPHPQFCSVFSLMPSNRANPFCDNPSLLQHTRHVVTGFHSLTVRDEVSPDRACWQASLHAL